MKIYYATGLVLGNYWGGGSGAYRATPLTNTSKKKLLDEANSKLVDGSLDGGMGYESLIGAILHITKEETIIVNKKSFSNRETEEVFIGKLNDEQKNFLMEASDYA